jgi:hypothetical protein
MVKTIKPLAQRPEHRVITMSLVIHLLATANGAVAEIIDVLSRAGILAERGARAGSPIRQPRLSEHPGLTAWP